MPHGRVVTKRGCAFDCSYCVYPALEGRRWRLREAGAVAEDVEAAARSGLRNAEIVDGVFGLPAAHAVECCEAIAASKTRIPLTTMELNPLGCTEELTEAMNAARVRGSRDHRGERLGDDARKSAQGLRRG